MAVCKELPVRLLIRVLLPQVFTRRGLHHPRPESAPVRGQPRSQQQLSWHRRGREGRGNQPGRPLQLAYSTARAVTATGAWLLPSVCDWRCHASVRPALHVACTSGYCAYAHIWPSALDSCFRPSSLPAHSSSTRLCHERWLTHLPGFRRALKSKTSSTDIQPSIGTAA